MPKNHEKLFARSVKEEDFRSKIPEKVRCVFHFANKLDKERKTYDWELFEDSQVRLYLCGHSADDLYNIVCTLSRCQRAEFPELHNLLTVYAKGFYTDR